jgi:hypothetical protein
LLKTVRAADIAAQQKPARQFLPGSSYSSWYIG